MVPPEEADELHDNVRRLFDLGRDVVHRAAALPLDADESMVDAARWFADAAVMSGAAFLERFRAGRGADLNAAVSGVTGLSRGASELLGPWDAPARDRFESALDDFCRYVLSDRYSALFSDGYVRPELVDDLGRAMARAAAAR